MTVGKYSKASPVSIQKKYPNALGTSSRAIGSREMLVAVKTTLRKSISDSISIALLVGLYPDYFPNDLNSLYV